MKKRNNFITAHGADSVTITEAVDFDKITLKNDVMFSSIFRDPEYCRELLQRILGIRISELTIAEEQKTLKIKPWNKGIRLDIYAKDIDGNVYDIEMQVLNYGDLPLRSRYYHSEMDCYQILRGQDYKELKSSIVIFLCTFDLFDQNRSIYTFQSLCREEPKISLMDHRQTIFVNINGSRQDLSPELANFLDYLKTTEPTDDFTDRLNSSVKKLRNDFDWRENYMTLEMKLKEQYNAGVKQGREEGKEEGRVQGIEEGRIQGIEAGKAEAIIDLIRQKLANGKSVAQIANECERAVETIQDLIAEMELKQ